MAAIQSLVGRALKLHTYAGMSYAVNTNDAAAAKRNGRVQGLWGQVMAAIAFLDPELLAIGEVTLRRWLAEDARLAYLGHTIDNLLRKQAHVRSAEVEELLGSFRRTRRQRRNDIQHADRRRFQVSGSRDRWRRRAARDAGHPEQDPGRVQSRRPALGLGRLHGHLPGA